MRSELQAVEKMIDYLEGVIIGIYESSYWVQTGLGGSGMKPIMLPRKLMSGSRTYSEVVSPHAEALSHFKDKYFVLCKRYGEQPKFQRGLRQRFDSLVH